MKKPKVTLTVDGTPYVPIRLVELQRLRAVEKAARGVIDAAQAHKLAPVTSRALQLRKLALAVRA